MPIAALLADLGFDTPAAATAARTALERGGLTRSGKRFIAHSKLPAVAALLRVQLARSCHDAGCLSALRDGRELVVVGAQNCERCGGSETRRSALRLGAVLGGRRLRVVVVGGSPGVHSSLEGVDVPGLELRLVDGRGRRTQDRARSDMTWADLVIVAASSELYHRVSNLYAQVDGEAKVVVEPRRGAGALLGAIETWLVRHPARVGRS